MAAVYREACDPVIQSIGEGLGETPNGSLHSTTETPPQPPSARVSFALGARCVEVVCNRIALTILITLKQNSQRTTISAQTIVGNATKPEVLKKAGIENYLEVYLIFPSIFDWIRCPLLAIALRH